jgi:hypothetical protein
VTSVIVGFIVLLLDLNGKIGFLHFVWAVLFPLVDFLLVEFLALRSSCQGLALVFVLGRVFISRQEIFFRSCLIYPLVPVPVLVRTGSLSIVAGSVFTPRNRQSPSVLDLHVPKLPFPA